MSDDEPFNFGNHIYEIYVTEEIKLPSHSLFLVNFGVGGFPMSIASYYKYLPGIVARYEVVEIEY